MTSKLQQPHFESLEKAIALEVPKYQLLDNTTRIFDLLSKSTEPLCLQEIIDCEDLFLPLVDHAIAILVEDNLIILEGGKWTVM